MTLHSDGVASRYQHSFGDSSLKTRAEGAAFIAGNPLDELYISIVTLAELRFGIELLRQDSTRRAELTQWLTHTIRPMFNDRVLPVTEDIMFRWRVLMEDGRKTGHTFSQPDFIIAATALQHGLTVVTRDRSDFDKTGAPVFDPWEQ